MGVRLETWVVLQVEPTTEQVVALKLETICEARGFHIQTSVPKILRPRKRGGPILATLMCGYVFVSVEDLVLVAQFRGMVDQISGFLSSAGRPHIPATIDSFTMGRFLTEIEAYNASLESPKIVVKTPPTKPTHQKPKFEPGQQVSVFGLNATALSDNRVSFHFLGRLIEASVSHTATFS